MDKAKLNEAVERYLNGAGDPPILDFADAADAHERFLLHAAKRLLKSFAPERRQDGMEDFLLSLRSYLLTLQGDIRVDGVPIPEDNAYGLVRDASDGRWHAVAQFPDYVNRMFAESVFLAQPASHRTSSGGFSLHTDPLIRRLTGFRRFKSVAQKLAVYGALHLPDGYAALISLPTGGGKSLITQTLAYQREGLTIVVVPTVSLAIDQVRTAKKIVQSAHVDEEIFFYSSGVAIAPILQAIEKKTAKMLFISPEALLKNEGFAEAVKKANAARYLRNLVIDEAHIVVDWGASFRVDYQCLESWRRMLLESNPGIRTVLLSATFDEPCCTVLKDFFSEDGEKWLEIRCDALRHEPRYMFVKAKSFADKQRKMLELVQKMPHPMIVYTARPVEAEDVADFLRAHGIRNVETFTGQTTGAARKERIDAWADDQFSVMAATSAFGVGVDKGDVRTVLHLYVPPNANAYYQELGRGGRDGLPCLSIMLCTDDDVQAAFGRISKRVMTTEKIVGRWNSMYKNVHSRRMNNLVYLDTSIPPGYADRDVFDDAPTSDADRNWNIYVLLFLRRCGLIKIREVIPDSSKYVFVVEITDDALRADEEEQTERIGGYREEEWAYYVKAFGSMRTAIKNCGRDCWSEMFYETYDRVSEFCAGCDAHDEVCDADFLDYPLKVPVQLPTKTFAADQLALFAGAKSIITIPRPEEREALMEALCRYRLAAYISCDDALSETVLEKINAPTHFMILYKKDLQELIKKKAYYYISGIIAVEYGGSAKDVWNLLQYVAQYLSERQEIKLVHILQENTYFEGQDKSFADLVDGAVLPVSAIL